MGRLELDMTIKLIVIDDDTAVTDLLSLLLKSQGFEVSATNNSSDGLNMIREIQPDLVILDLMLPELDGLEVCRRIRWASPVPVLMLTAKGLPEDVAFGLEAGADDYLPKPFDLPVLLARVKGLIRRRDWARGATAEAVRVGPALVAARTIALSAAGRRAGRWPPGWARSRCRWPARSRRCRTAA